MQSVNRQSGGVVHDQSQLVALRALASRILVQLRIAMREVPAAKSPTSELARWLNVNRSICHWAKAACSHEGEPVLLFGVLPGVEGLEALLRALRRKVDAPRKVDGALAAVQVYREAVGIAGGSQAKLVRLCDQLLRSERGSSEPDPDLARRERLFAAAAELCGSRSRAFCLSCVIYPAASADEMSCVAALGQVDVERAAVHLPLVLARQRDVATFRGADQTLEGDLAGGFTPGAVIGRFSTLPLPIATTEGGDKSHVAVLDPTRAAPNRLTAFVGQRFSTQHPRLTDHRTFLTSAIPRVPTQTLLFDLHVHEGLAFTPPPVCAAHFVGAEGPTRDVADSRWYDRLTNTITARSLDRSPDALATDAFGAMPELTDYLVQQSGQDRSQFRSWRLEMRYPAWGIQYLMTMKAQPRQD
jgi:hypothetical protein